MNERFVADLPTEAEWQEFRRWKVARAEKAALDRELTEKQRIALERYNAWMADRSAARRVLTALLECRKLPNLTQYEIDAFRALGYGQALDRATSQDEKVEWIGL